MSTNQIRLDELLARHVDVQWFEGVAILQAICRQLLATGASNGEFPAATQIGVSADGAVRVLEYDIDEGGSGGCTPAGRPVERRRAGAAAARSLAGNW